MSRLAFPAIAAVIALAGCAATEKPVALAPFEASRADGVISMGAQFDILTIPVIDYDAAQADAEARCKAWGYTSAEALGSTQRICRQSDSYGTCILNEVRVPYQCVGAGTPG